MPNCLQCGAGYSACAPICRNRPMIGWWRRCIWRCGAADAMRCSCAWTIGRCRAGPPKWKRCVWRGWVAAQLRLQIHLLLNALTPFLRVERLAAGGIVGQLPVMKTGRAGVGVLLDMFLVLYVQDPGATDHQHIGNQRTVATPPEHLGAHHAGPLSRCQFPQALQTAGEFPAGRMVRIAAERGVTPCSIGRVG